MATTGISDDEKELLRIARKSRARRRLTKSAADPHAHLTGDLLAERYNTTRRTIDRWRDDPRLKFPPPDLIIFRRKFWRLETIQAWEQQQAAAAAA